MLGFEFLTVGFHGAVWMMKKYCMHQWKKIAGPHMFFIQILIIWQKIKEKRKREEEEVSIFPFSTLWIKALSCVSQNFVGDVNRGQTNCRYCYYSDLTRLRESTWLDRSHPFALQISKLLSLWHSSAGKNLSFSVTKVNSKTVNVSWKQTRHAPELKGL